MPKGKPFLSGVQHSAGGLKRAEAGAERVSAEAAEPTRVENPDGTVTLRSPTIRDLMRHILETVNNGEEELFTEQLLSVATRREFVERGYDPDLAFAEITRRQADVRRLFGAMPAGEYTPGIYMRTVGRNVFRLKVEGDPSLAWSFIDVVLDDGEFTLRWFGR